MDITDWEGKSVVMGIGRLYRCEGVRGDIVIVYQQCFGGEMLLAISSSTESDFGQILGMY